MISDEMVINILESLTDLRVILSDGRELSVINVSAGQDDGEIGYHVSTNMSGDFDGSESEFFSTRDVVEIWQGEIFLYEAPIP